MAPEEKSSFYLYSIGYSPKILTLGTLVFDNYGMPENRKATFPMSESEFKKLEEEDEIITTDISGCFTYNKQTKYGLGVDVAAIAAIDFEYAKTCQKIVEAKAGRRVILNDPDEFFLKVLQQKKTVDKLQSWLTVAKSAWLFYKATFQKPRVYCCTGFYELSQTTARITNGGEFTSKLSVSPEVVAVASGGVPMGGTIAPFSNGKSLESNFSASAPGIWAARYHQLKVEYIQLATTATDHPPRSITLKPDWTHPRNGLMGDAPVIKETRVVEKPDEIQFAQKFVVTLGEPTEIEDESQNKNYWDAFDEAEQRLEPKHDAELDMDLESTDEEENGPPAAADLK